MSGTGQVSEGCERGTTRAGNDWVMRRPAREPPDPDAPRQLMRRGPLGPEPAGFDYLVVSIAPAGAEAPRPEA